MTAVGLEQTRVVGEQHLKTAGIKRKRHNPWPFLRWVYLARWVLARIRWWRCWAIRDRLSYLRQFNPADIYFFAEDGLESWHEV